MLARVPTRYPDILHRFNGGNEDDSECVLIAKKGRASMRNFVGGRLQGVNQILAKRVDRSLPCTDVELSTA